MPVIRVETSIAEGSRNLRSLRKEIAVDEWVWREFEIADGASESDLFPDDLTTMTVFYIESDQTLTYVYTTAETTSTVTATGYQLHADCSFTTLLISNASGSTANVKLGCGGT